MTASVLANNTVEDHHKQAIDVSLHYVPDLSDSLPVRAKMRNPRWKVRRDMEVGRIPQPIRRSAGSDVFKT